MAQCKSERRACRSLIAGEEGGVGKANVIVAIVERVRSIDVWRCCIFAWEMLESGFVAGEIVVSSAFNCDWEVIYSVLGPIPNGAGTMLLRVVFLFLQLGS